MKVVQMLYSYLLTAVISTFSPLTPAYSVTDGLPIHYIVTFS